MDFMPFVITTDGALAPAAKKLVTTLAHIPKQTWHDSTRGPGDGLDMRTHSNDSRACFKHAAGDVEPSRTGRRGN